MPIEKTSNDLPQNTSIIIPRLVCRDPAAEVEFCVRAFEAVELNKRPGPDGTLAHALLKIGPEMIMIESEWPSLPRSARTGGIRSWTNSGLSSVTRSTEG
jgi:PhnB protein